MSWQQIRGHAAQIEAFRRAVKRGRLAHAYLFTGPGGVGKHRFAVELAKALLCEARPAGAAEPLDACGRCHACVQVDAGSHPDFVAAARPEDRQEFPVALMHEVCHAFTLKSSRSRGKIVVLDDADDLNQESANCFLKTLEEPPPRSVLILVGSAPDRQLATIVSRCQVVRFAPLPPKDVDDLLKENGVEDADLRSRLARLSGGSVGMALALADADLLAFRRRLVDTLGQARFDPVALAKEWAEFAESAGKESAPQRVRARLTLRLLTEFLTDALAVGQGGEPRRSEPADRAALDALAGRANAETIMAALERGLEADEQVERRVQLVLVLEGLLDALAQRLG